MKPFMIVVADSTRARIFTAENAKAPLVEIDTLAHPAGRLHDRDITSDLPGKDKGGDGSGGHAYQEETDPKKHEMEEFAQQVSGYVGKAHNAGKFSDLLLVSAPTFLGELRNHLPADASAKVVFELDKNLTKHSSDDIRAHLPKFLTH